LKRILVVDDSTVMRKNLRSILTGAGYSVVGEASNGEEACHSYEQLRPDLVTMDVTIPILNGIEAVKRIIAAYPDANFIVISAFDQRSMLFEALENGAKHYIIKPITSEKLLTAVDKVFNEQSAIMEQATVDSGLQARTAASQPPVTIDNRNGTFVVNIPADTSPEGLDPIRTALQGLLFIKPLSMQFNFGTADIVREDLLRSLEGILDAIRQAGGSIAFAASDPSLRKTLQGQFRDILVHDE
jgi:DNA-binding NarL/FixJ family response regulator